MARLNLNLLGCPSVALTGEEVTGFTSSKVQALLFYLAVTQETHRRASLAALLWPNTSEQKAHMSLRNALATLRKLLPDYLDVERFTVSLRTEDLWVDTQHFNVLLKRTNDPMTDARQRQAAVSLYVGEFLTGFHVPDASPFEEWATIVRQQLRQAMITALMDLAQWHVAQHDSAASLDTLANLLGLEPGNEAAHRLKMRILARTGQRSAAILQFDTCRRYLAEELGVDPEAETVALYGLLLEGVHDSTPTSPPTLSGDPPAVPTPMMKVPEMDWGEMPGRTLFFGRPQRLLQALQWLTAEKCSLIAVTGIGGAGKTAFVGELVHRLTTLPTTEGGYDRIVWRSLVNAPSLDELVADWLRVLSHSQPDHQPITLSEKLSLLFTELQNQRCLLVLDNAESLLDSGEQRGRYRREFAEYRQLTERMAYGRHCSCLVMTTRESPQEISRMAADYAQVKVMNLTGLTPHNGVELLSAYGVQASSEQMMALVSHYSGNPLALKLVATTISTLYGGDVGSFLDEETFIFDDIREVLGHHFALLSDLERDIATCLAVERAPVHISQLRDLLVAPPARSAIVEAVRVLRRSSLLTDTIDPDYPDAKQDDEHAGLTLQNVVMEYITDRLLNLFFAELEEGRADTFHRFGLHKAHAAEHVQDVQRRLLLQPLAERALRHYGLDGTVRRLRALRDNARCDPILARGYVGANVFQLMRHLQINLTGEDFSRLALRQADMRQASLANVNFHGADLSSARFADDFGGVWTVAISPDGRFLAAGADHNVFVWQITDLQPYVVFQGHTHHLTAIAFSADSRYLASVGYDGALYIRSLAMGQVNRVLTVTQGVLHTVAFSPDGRYVASGGDGQTIWIWHAESGEVVTTLATKGTISGLAFGAEGKIFALVGHTGEVQCWNMYTQQIEYTLRAGEEHYYALTLSPDGATAVVGGQDNLVYVWNLRKRTLLHCLTGHSAWVLVSAFCPNNRHFATAGADGTVRIWDLKNGELVRTLSGHRGWVHALAYSPDGRTLISGGYDQTVRIWDVTSGLQQHRFQGHMRWINSLLFSPDSAVLAGATLSGVVYLWDGQTGRARGMLRGHDAPVRGMAFSPDSQTLASGSDDNNVYLWDVATGRMRHTLSGHTDMVRVVAIDHTGQVLVSGSQDKTLRVWQVASGRLLRVIPNAFAHIMDAIGFCPNHNLLVYGDYDRHIVLYDFQRDRILQRVPIPAHANVFAFSPHNGYFACATKDGTVMLWQLVEGADGPHAVECYRVQKTHKRPWRLRFSPDGAMLVWNCEGTELFSLDVASGEVALSIAATHRASCVEIGRAGRSLITDGPEHNVVVRDIVTSKIEAILEGHTSDLAALALSPNGALLASSDASGIVKLWEAESGRAMATMQPSGPYQGMNITGASGLTQARRQVLITLGAVEDTPVLESVIGFAR